jgi:small-conductance mechanosensitive channel
MEILTNEIYGNSVQKWLLALAVFLFLFIVIALIKRIFTRKSEKLVKGTKTHIDDMFADGIKQTRNWFIVLVSLYFGSQMLSLPDNLILIRNTIIALVVIVQIGFWGNGFINYWILKQGILKAEDGEIATNMNVMGYVLKVALWSIIIILSLDNIPGIEVNSLLASLGIGGVAVALAVQNILGDLFASLSIALDKPFVIGDLLVIGEFQGKVERIGLNSTRIRSLDGQEIIFSNADLLKSRISNYKSLERRRVLFTLGVAPETPYVKLKNIPKYIQDIIETQDNTTFDRAHFKEFGDFTLKFEVVYHIESPDFSLYMNIQQAINLLIIQKFEEEMIIMPYPTQSILIGKNSNISAKTG